MDGAAAVDALVEALYDAADEDAATGGPDLIRGIFPVIATVTSEGYRRLPDAEVRKAAERVVDARARGEG
jgi:proteasome beta subunit